MKADAGKIAFVAIVALAAVTVACRIDGIRDVILND